MTSFDFRRWNSDLVGLAVGLAVAGFQKFWRVRREQRAETWPVCYGRVNRGSVDSENQKAKLKCFYTYRVGAESFVGSFQKTFEDADEAHAWADALDNQQVAVHYDPSNPSRSQLRETDLRPIVQAAAPMRLVGTPAAAISAWERMLISALLVVSILGLAISMTALFEEFTGRTLMSPTVASGAGICAYPVFLVAMWFRRKRKSTKAPEWMKYLNYALLYYALFATIVPSHPAQQNFAYHRRPTDARYQLFLYFSAFEWCYASLPERDETAQNAFPSFPTTPPDNVT